MRTKPPGQSSGDKPEPGAAPPSTVEGEKTVIHVGPDEIEQRTPWQLRSRPLSLVDVIGYTVMASTILLGGVMAFAFIVDRVRDWLDV